MGAAACGNAPMTSWSDMHVAQHSHGSHGVATCLQFDNMGFDSRLLLT